MGWKVEGKNVGMRQREGREMERERERERERETERKIEGLRDKGKETKPTE